MDLNFQDIIYTLAITFPIFLFSLSVHEMAHALTAAWGGDLTAAYQGRITLNPVSHIDPIGTLAMPVLATIFAGLPLIGWARPVPVVETNYKRGDGYGVVVALAGPFSNLVLALLTAVAIQCYLITVYLLSRNGVVISGKTDSVIQDLLRYALQINIFLMLFNLIPIPPLDGSHVLWHWFVKGRPRLVEIFMLVRRFGLLALIIFVSSPLMTVYYAAVFLPIYLVLNALAYWPMILR